MKRYYVPIEHEGQKKTLVISETTFKQLAEKLKGMEPFPEMVMFSPKMIPVRSSEIDWGRYYQPYVPAEFSLPPLDDVLSPSGLKNGAKLTTVVAKKGRGFSHISYKWLMRLITSARFSVQPMEPGILAGLMDVGNPCAEVELPNPLVIDEDYYIPKRTVAPAVIADPKMYPHECPRCKSPAYVGLQTVDCSRKSCS